MSEIRQQFEEEIGTRLTGFVLRDAQIDLAENIEAVIESGSVGLFEAGTGTGKTLSYLLPAFMGDGTVIVSTATRNLQDQLLYNDVPLLAPMFPDRRVAVLKGRTNYLCPYRLDMHLRTINRRGESKLDQLVEVRQWAVTSKTGDLGEFMDLEEASDILGLITSTRDNCLGGRCPKINECPLYRAREKARLADIVIVNHHLLFADLAQRDENLQSLLPSADAVILDEAHHAAEIARQFFGERISSAQLMELVRDSLRELAELGNDEPTVLRAVSDLEQAGKRLSGAITESDETDFGLWLSSHGGTSIEGIDLALEQLTQQLGRIADRSEGIALLARRGAGLLDLFTLLTEVNEEDAQFVHWIDRRDRGYVIHLSPLSVAPLMAGAMSETGAWVFISATLTVNQSFEHFSNELGLETDIKATFPSPFDYQQAVLTLVPPDLPEPGNSRHTQRLVEAVLPIILSHNDRTFFLFTSHRALNEAAELLHGLSRPVLVQGTMSRSQLMEKFRSLEGSVLLATQSFWEGVDARGAGLRCLIIDKLPFPSPGDPVFSALCRDAEQSGVSSFDHLSLPRATLALKQGFGRLIREETDRGLFVLGDPRMLTRRYRHYFIENLPEMRWTEDTAEAGAWFGNGRRLGKKVSKKS